jgi:hypothetical protein
MATLITHSRPCDWFAASAVRLPAPAPSGSLQLIRSI